jgi:hypothetical protein
MTHIVLRMIVLVLAAKACSSGRGLWLCEMQFVTETDIIFGECAVCGGITV